MNYACRCPKLKDSVPFDLKTIFKKSSNSKQQTLTNAHELSNNETWVLQYEYKLVFYRQTE